MGLLNVLIDIILKFIPVLFFILLHSVMESSIPSPWLLCSFPHAINPSLHHLGLAYEYIFFYRGWRGSLTFIRWLFPWDRLSEGSSILYDFVVFFFLNIGQANTSPLLLSNLLLWPSFPLGVGQDSAFLLTFSPFFAKTVPPVIRSRAQSGGQLYEFMSDLQNTFQNSTFTVPCN